MPVTRCMVCSTDFYVKPSHLKRGWGKYCSSACRSKSQFNGKVVNCYMCNEEIYRTQKDLKSSKSNKFFCSKRCQTIWRNTEVYTGENHSNWIHGRSAYRRILSIAGKEQVCMLCTSKDKRVLIVHHIDKNRKNNKVNNLIWLCHNCHYLVHHDSDERVKLMNMVRQNMVVVVQK